MPAQTPQQRAPRGRRPIVEKRRIVELTLRKGASIRAVAREHGVHPNSVRQWKALYRSGKLGTQTPARRARASSATFLPVRLVAAARPPQSIGDRVCGPSVVHITLLSGVTVRIESGALDAEMVCTLVAQLQR
jgi:transposase-like protein